jgi:hypothetical protein
MKCGHDKTQVILTPEYVHYGKLVCSECGSFIKWVSDPYKKAYKDICGEMLDECIQHSNNAFIKSCQTFYEKHGALSEKQYYAVKKIHKELIEK